jgi:hypothetical protein
MARTHVVTPKTKESQHIDVHKRTRKFPIGSIGAEFHSCKLLPGWVLVELVNTYPQLP